MSDKQRIIDLQKQVRIARVALEAITPLKLRKRITYLLQGGQFGIEPGYCVLGLAND